MQATILLKVQITGLCYSQGTQPDSTHRWCSNPERSHVTWSSCLRNTPIQWQCQHVFL